MKNRVGLRITKNCRKGNLTSFPTGDNKCREDGDDEDLRCLWIPLSEDEEDREAAHADAVSVATWTGGA